MQTFIVKLAEIIKFSVFWNYRQILKMLSSTLSWKQLMLGVKSFYKNDHTWMDYRLVLSTLKFIGLQLLVSVWNDVSYHVNLGFFQRSHRGKICSLIYQWLLSSEKTKVTQFARLCKIMICDNIWNMMHSWISIYDSSHVIVRARIFLYK